MVWALWENLAVVSNSNVSLGEALIFVLPQFSHLQNLGLERGISKVTTHTEIFQSIEFRED